MGLPTIRTAENRESVCGFLRLGHTRKAAARQCGFSVEGLRVWMRDDPGFAADVKKAESESTAALLEMLRIHATQTWQTAAWLLERRDPEWRSNADKLKARELGRPQPPIQFNFAQQAALQARLAEYEPLQLPSHATSTQVQEQENEHDDDTQDPLDPEPE